MNTRLPFSRIPLPLLALGVCLLLGMAQPERAPAQDAAANGVHVTHGPILGRPGPDRMSLWVRTNQAGPVRVFYGTDPDRLDNTATLESTDVDHDNTGILTLTDLEPRTRYHYRVENSQLTGSFRTLPAAELFRDATHNPDGLFNFRFEFACGSNQAGGGDSAGPTLPAFDILNRDFADKVDFAILNGDWLYEEDRAYPLRRWVGQVGIAPEQLPRITKMAPTITGVWENYKTYLSRGRNLSQWHRNVPSFYTYDDHETLNDIYGTAERGYVNRRAVFRDTGVRAWFDYLAWSNPVEHDVPAWFGRAKFQAGSDILEDPEANFTELPLEEMANLLVHWGKETDAVKDMELDKQPGDPNAAVYDILEVLGPNQLRIAPAAKADGESAYSIGRRCYGKMSLANCDFFFLDTRSHRDLHDVANPDKPGVSMLGKQQVEWLKKGIAESDSDFVFVVSSVNFMVPHVGSGGGDDINAAVAKDDAWTVFLEEREDLIRFWDQSGKHVFVLTGDLHNSFAIKITDNVWEFASGPHNSINHTPEKDEGDRPVNGVFQYGPRPCEIRWSSYAMADIPRPERVFPTFCVVQVNNVFNNPVQRDEERWIAYPHPQVIFQFYDGLTGELRYSETIVSGLD